MSSADRRARAAERGFTLLEATVVLGLLGGITLLVERIVSSMHDTERTFTAIRHTTERSHRAAYQLRDAVSSSRRLFADDATGSAYLAALDLGARPLAAGARLPVFDEVRPLGPDEPGDPRVGNVLLFVREADPVPCVADPATRRTRAVDTHRFVCVYLSPSGRSLVTGNPSSNDLVEWRSWAYPNYGQVASIPDVDERESVVRDLHDVYHFDELWDPTAPYATAFYGIDGTGRVSSTPGPPATGRIDEDPLVSRGGRFANANIAVAQSDGGSRPRTPAFSVEPLAAWAPDGFEVKVCGTSGARKVWIRLTLEKQAFRGQVPAQDIVVVANTRDL